jgi:hypothetical protein
VRAGRVVLRHAVHQFFEDLFSNPAHQPHDLTPGQALAGEELRFNRDPFDALVCAAARDLELPLITRDGEIRGSGAGRVIWQPFEHLPRVVAASATGRSLLHRWLRAGPLGLRPIPEPAAVRPLGSPQSSRSTDAPSPRSRSTRDP